MNFYAPGIGSANGLFSDDYSTPAIRRLEVRQASASAAEGMVIRSSTTATNTALQFWAGTGGFVIDATLGNLTGSSQIQLRTGGIDRLIVSSSELLFKNGTKLTLGDSLKGIYAGRVKAVVGNTAVSRLPAGWSLVNYTTSIALYHTLGTDAFSFQATSQYAEIVCTTSVDSNVIYVYFKRISDGAVMDATNFTFTAALY